MPTHLPPVTLFSHLRYLVVEGPIGVGKKTLARRLGQHLSARLMLDEAWANPFLPSFYQDMRRYAFQTQLAFLFQRLEQVSPLKQGELFADARCVISDFLFDKDYLFAELTLNEEEFRLYANIYRHLQIQVPRPDLVILLQAEPRALLERVRQRATEYESPIDLAYLQKLDEHYKCFFYDYDEAPLLIVNTDRLDLADSEEDFALLLERIAQVKSGRTYFNRA